MRLSTLPLRRRTPPPRRLMSPVPASSTQIAASQRAVPAEGIACDTLNNTVVNRTVASPLCSLLYSQASSKPTHIRSDVSLAKSFVLQPSSTAVEEAQAVTIIDAMGVNTFSLSHNETLFKKAALQTSFTNIVGAGVSHAGSAPLRVSFRCFSEGIRTGKSQAEDEDVHTSFGAESTQLTFPTSPASAMQSSRNISNSSGAKRAYSRQQLQQLPPHISSAQLLGRSTDFNRYNRRDGGFSTTSTSFDSASATDGDDVNAAPQSKAALSAHLMRRHRVRTTQPYLSLSSGEEVPGCGGGAYHLQDRRDSCRASSGARMSAYAGRVRNGGNNVRMLFFPSRAMSSSSLAPSTAASPNVLLHDATFTRMQSYEPFERLFRRYLERGHVVNATQRLLHHPNAPAPLVLLDRILQHRVPAPTLVSQALLSSMHAPRSDRSTSAAVTLALERIATRLQTEESCRVLYDIPCIRGLLLEATLQESLFDLAMGIVQDTPASWITPHTWSLLVQAAGQSKLPHSQILWRLLSIQEGSSSSSAAEQGSRSMYGSGSMQRVLTRAGESALLRRVAPWPPYNSPLSEAPPVPPVPPSSAASAFGVTEGSKPVEASLRSSSNSNLSAPPSTSHSYAPSSQLPLDATQIPGSVFEARACGAVLMPPFMSIGTPLFESNTHGTTTTSSSFTNEVESEGSLDGSSVPALPPSFSATSSALIPSVFNTEGMRWCALSPVDMGYATEHYNGDTATAAGDFRAASVTGVLHGFSSFQSLLAEVEESVQHSKAAAADDSSLLALTSRDTRRALWETTALRMVHQHHGIVYGLDATTTARVLLRCGVGFSGQASPMLALHVLRRYLRSCHLLRDGVMQAQELIEAQLEPEESMRKYGDGESKPTVSATNSAAEAPSFNTTTTAVTSISPRSSAQKLLALYPNLSRAVAPHPSPFLVFFRVMREAREVLSNAVEEAATTGISGASAATAAGRSHATVPRQNNSLPMVHWELVWHVFQQLNRENPCWFTQMTVQEAGDMSQDVIEVLCHGADPWLTLNVSRRVSIRHLVDGVDMSLWLLHHLNPSHHTEEAREVARKLFRWLLVDVGLHLQPSLHHHLIPAARALIRLGLQEELRVLYSAVLDNVYLFLPEHRDAFMEVLRDLICPSCATILPESDVYVDRACPNCMTVVPAKDADTIPSFRLSAEHVERLRARRKQQRQRSRQRLTASVHRLQDGETNAVRSPQLHKLRPPQDAAEVLRRHLQRSKEEEENGEGEDGREMALMLSDAATLVPGVSVGSDYALFPLAGGTPVLDIRAAMEESSRRLELQRAARRYALAQRGEADDDSRDASLSRTNSGGLTPTRRTAAAMPTTLPISAQALDAATLKYLSTAANANAQASTAAATQDGIWVCVWCQEKNTEWSSRVQCSACGAETGPSAPWRHFAYVDPADGDAMTELRGRMSNCEERPVDAIVAGYMLMVYRRTFQLRATPADQERLQRLVAMLCRLQERVLAGYVYTRVVPITQRQLGPLLDLLAQTYGQENETRYRALTPDVLTRPERESAFFEAVFGPRTCRVCFGNHDWHRCPIVTRDFVGAAAADGKFSSHQQRSPISLSPEEKQQVVLERLAQRIHQAAQSSSTATTDKPNAQLVVDAYTAFVSSPFREVFAELHANDTNQLSLLLSRLQQYRRAAFVLCHIPLAQRSTEAYLKLVHFFNVTEEEALMLLERKGKDTPSSPQQSQRKDTAAASDATPVPNFVQVTKTCCMCLDQRHASHECPRLEEWLKGVRQLTREREAVGPALVDSIGNARLRQRLRAQVDGWTTAGPERLHAFYRYLETHMELLRPSTDYYGASLTVTTVRPIDLSDPLVYAVNKTVTKLATLHRCSEAYRLYAHAPVECVSTTTTSAMLRMNGFAEDSIRALNTGEEEEAKSGGGDGADSADADLMMARSSSSSVQALSRVRHAPLAARIAAVPIQRCCLMCFSSAHAYVDCPELAAAASEAEKLLLVVREVGGISSVTDGIGGAAAYVYSEYNRGRLSSEMMRSNPALVAALLTLVRRCFATHQLSHGVRVLRRIPIEMVPPTTTYADLWRAAGLPEEEVEQRQTQLLALFDAEGLVPCVDPPPPRLTYSNGFLSQLSRTLHDGLCRHCYEHGHTIATCPLFHSEVSFGRDYVAAYRMSMMSEQLDRAWQEAYLLKLVDFFSTHYLFMPYHIAGVANALNAITAMWSFRGEPGIALRNLLLIPPAYRRRQAFKHVLHCLRVPSPDITRLLGNFYFAPDSTSSNSHSSSGGGLQQQQEMVMAQHLLIPKPAIRDVARRHIFEQVPGAMAALEESADRMAQIRANHERRGGAGASASFPSSSLSSSSSANTEGGSVGISARIAQSLRQQQSSPDADGASASSFNSPILRRVMQSGGMAQLRDDFDPILAELESAVGMRLGSRHMLFTSALDILGSAATSSSGEHSPRATSAAQSSPTTPSSAGGSASSPADAVCRRVQEAEVVMEVQTQSNEAHKPPSSSAHPKQRSTVQTRPPSLQSQRSGQGRGGTSQLRKTPTATAGSPGRVKAHSSSSSGGGAREASRAASRVNEDEVLSSFPETSTRASPQQLPQRPERRAGNDSGTRNYRGSRNNSQRLYSNDGQKTQQQSSSQSRSERRGSRGDKAGRW